MSPRIAAVLAAFALFAVFAPGCEASFDTEQGRKYPCDPTLEASAQCPEDFLCALEGYCRSPAERGTWLCDETHPCPSIDGEDWYCGQAAGPESPRRCYDRADAGTISCRYDAGVSDCATGWTCGVDGRCHDPSPRPYDCYSDADCTSEWRCGVDSVCHPVAARALRPPVPLGALRETMVSPQLPREVNGFDLGYLFVDDEELFYDKLVDTFVVARDGGLTVVDFAPEGFKSASGKVVFARRADFPMFPSPSAVRLHYRESPLGDFEAAPIVTTGGVLKDYSAPLQSEDGRAEVLGAAPQDAKLFSIYGVGDELLIAAGGRDHSTYTFETKAVTPIEQGHDAGVPWSFNAIAPLAVDARKSAALGATSIGLFYAPRSEEWVGPDGGQDSSPNFRPVHHAMLPNRACSSTGTDVRALETYSAYSETLDHELVGASIPRPDGTWDIALGWFDRATAPPEASCANLFEKMTVCPACPAGESFEFFSIYDPYAIPSSSDIDYVVYTMCAKIGPEGARSHSTYRSSRLISATCSLEPHDEGPQTAPPWGLREGDVVAEEHHAIDSAGRPYYGLSYHDGFYVPEPGHYYPEMLDVQPSHYVGTPESANFYALTPYQTEDGGLGTEAFKLEPGIGFVHAYLSYRQCVSEEQVLGGVKTRPDWLLATNATQSTVFVRRASDLNVGVDYQGDCKGQPSAPIAELQTASTISLSWPGRPLSFASTAVTPDGGTALAVAMADRLWVGDLTKTLATPNALPQSIPVRAVPLPFANISDLALLTHDPELEPHYLAGYLLVTGRLFRFEAPTVERYQTREIVVPGELVSVFADGPRGRVGTRSADVYSLPEPVLIGAGPLAPDDPVAFDYAELCGDSFAIGAKSLYRLEPVPDGPVGQWRKLAVNELLPSDPELSDLGGAHFVPARDALYVMTRAGIMLRVAYTSCTRP